MVLFILPFLYLLLTIGFQCSYLAQKIRNNTEEAPFYIPGANTEPEEKLRVKQIF